MEGHYEITPYTFRPRVAKKYNPETQYLVFTTTGWAIADKPSFDEEE